MNRKDWEAYIYGLDVAPRGTKLVNFKAVALCLAYHSDWSTLENVSVSMQTIAKETSLHRNTVDKMVNAMMDIGLATRRDEKRIWSTGTGKWTNVYDLRLPTDSHLDVKQVDVTDEQPDITDSHPEGTDSHSGGTDSHSEGTDSHLDVNNHTYNQTKDHTKEHTKEHTVQDGDQNRGCDGNEPTGTQTASQQSSDLTKKGEDMKPSSDFKTNTPDSSDSKTNTAERTALKAPSSDSKTNAAPEPEASLDSKTSSADSDSLETPNWLIFKASKTELCQHDKIGFCLKCDTADLADLQDAVSLL